MELDIIKSQTTWNDASQSINLNFAKIRQALASSGGGGGNIDALISTVYDISYLGSISTNDNSATFNAYAIDSLYKRIVLLENKEVDLTGYATETWVLAKNYITAAALSPYLKTADANSTFATLVALNALSGNVGSLEGDVSTLSSNLNTLKGRFDALDDALNDDVSGKINTWNEIVDFLDEYSGSEDLATVLSGMNADIASRLKSSDFDTWKTDVYSPLAARVSTAEGNISTNAKGIADNKTAIATNKNNISANATAITNLGKKVTANEGNIAKILKWFAVDADGNLYTTYNLYSTKEISANGLSIGSGGSGSGLISQVYGTTAFGTIESESNSATFNAYAIDSLYKRIVSLEGKATAVSFVPAMTSGKQIGTLSIDGVSTALYAPAGYAWSEVSGKPTLIESEGVAVDGSPKVNRFGLWQGKGAYWSIGHDSNYVIQAYATANGVYLRSLTGNTDSGWKKILREGDAYSKTDADGRYLKLSGGKVSGEVKINGKNTLAAPLIIETPSMGYSGYIQFTDGSTEIGWLGFSNKVAVIRQGTTNSTIYHSGNFNPANYLPLTGGTISLATMAPLNIQRTSSGAAAIAYSGPSSTYGYIGFNDTTAPKWWDSSYKEYTLIHSGNIGEYKAGDSDKLGGVSEAEYARYSTNIYTTYHRYIGYGTTTGGFPQNGGAVVAGIANYSMLLHGRNGVFRFNTMENGSLTGWKTIAFTDSNVASADVIATAYANQSIDLGKEGKVRMIYGTASNATSLGYPRQYTSGLSVLTGYSGWQMVTYGGTSIPNPYFRSLLDNGTFSDWKQLAFLTDNVASATKLATARTIWGQSFDGTGNVSGTLYDVNNIYPNSTAERYIGTSSNPFKYMYAEWYGAGTGQTLSFGANNATHMFITTSGNVGIGTTDPKYKLDVNGAANIADRLTIFSSSNSAFIAAFEMSSSGLSIQPRQENVGYINTILNKTGGNVGIGTTNPQHKLEVTGDIASSGSLRMGLNSAYGAYLQTNEEGWTGIYSANKGNWQASNMYLMPDGDVRFAHAARIIGKNTNGDTGLFVEGTQYSMWFGIGSGNVNRGIFDISNNGWWIYRGSDTLTRISGGIETSTGSFTGKVTANYVSVSYDGLRFSDNANYALFMDSSNKVNLRGYYGINLNGAVGVTGLLTANSGVKVASGQALTFLDASGKEHKLTYDSTAGAFKFDGNILVTGDGQFNAIN